MKKQLGAILALVPLTVGLAACGGSDSGDDKTVTIGVVGVSKANTALKKEAQKQGITVKFQQYQQYDQVNPALEQGAVDMNWFQHIEYLGKYDVDKNKDDIGIVGGTAIYPMGLYSKKHHKVSEIPQGAEIAIPNDAVNETRAILVLKSAGLVKLKNDKTLPTKSDVDQKASKVALKSVDATQTALSLDSVDGSIINNDFLEKADIDPKSAIAQDDPKSDDSLPYVNFLAAQKDKQDDETYRKVAEIYHSAPVQKAESEESKGTSVESKTDVKKLRETLTKVEKDLKDQSK